MIVFIGMETSGALRRRFQALGHETYSCDVLPSEDGGEKMTYSRKGLPLGRHLVGDVFENLDNMRATDMWPELAIFHPTCTWMTSSAAWALRDPDYVKYPKVGYHQKVKPGTLVGKARRKARAASLDQVRKIMALPIMVKVIENPIGAIGTNVMPPSQIIQPHQYGEDASKATCLWFIGEDGRPLVWSLTPTKHVQGRRVEWPRGSGKVVERWANQLDSGCNKLSPSKDRWKDRSRTFDGVADAMATQLSDLMSLLTA